MEGLPAHAPSSSPFKKLYASQLFKDILPVLKTAEKYHIANLVVDKTGIVICYIQPVGYKISFIMKAHGYAYLSPAQQEALRVVLEERLPNLKDNARYYVSRKRSSLLNGDIEYNYHYTVNSRYKTKLVRASYYDGSLQTNLW